MQERMKKFFRLCRSDDFVSIGFPLICNKKFYLSLEKGYNDRTVIEARYRTKVDDAGFQFWIDCPWFGLWVEIIDKRYWDYNNNCWEGE